MQNIVKGEPDWADYSDCCIVLFIHFDLKSIDRILS